MHNETYEQKRRRLFGKVNYLPEYLNTLRRILKTEVTTNQLLSIVDTDDFYHEINLGYVYTKKQFLLRTKGN